MCQSPQLIAAYHVLHRLLEPRHPPCALICFIYLFITHSHPHHLLLMGNNATQKARKRKTRYKPICPLSADRRYFVTLMIYTVYYFRYRSSSERNHKYTPQYSRTGVTHANKHCTHTSCVSTKPKPHTIQAYNRRHHQLKQCRKRKD